MRKSIIFAIVISAAYWLTGCDNKDKLEINSPAYMYESISGVDQEVDVVLSGLFNENENSFKGSMTIKNVNYATILFKSGAGLISYEDKKRTYLGEIFYNSQTRQYTIEISDSDLYEELTGQKYSNNKLVISSPAKDLDQAKQINTTIKNNQDK